MLDDINKGSLLGRPFPENFVPEGREQSVYRVSAEYQAFVLLLPGWVVCFKAHLMRGYPRGASKLPIGKRRDVPLLVPVRHKPVLGSLHLGVVMACTTSTTSCQGCTETNFSGMDATE